MYGDVEVVAGVTETVGTTTFPVSGTVPEVAGAATVTFNVAVFVPVDVGLKVMFTVQLVPAVKVAGKTVGQVPPAAMANWPGFVPPRVMLLIVSVDPPIFDTVTV